MSAQGDLFATDAPARRDLGIARSKRSAENEHGSEWTLQAALHLRDFARQRLGAPFLIENAIEACPLPKPTSGRAWGAATQAAARKGWIEKAGGSAPAKTSNLAPKWLWKAGRA